MKELPKTYNPQGNEDEIYARWEKSGYFSPEKCVADGIAKEDAPHFSIVLPPPNVTGHLHMGHAAMLAIEDLTVRFHRMRGDRTLWIPGTDHAAIATQEKVERILYEKEGLTRHDLGRKEFLKRVEKFAQDSHDTIVTQVKKMGSSLDWSREAFTLDEQRNHAVRTAFKKMHDDGIIYRGHRIINWDPKMQTTVSDDELERKEGSAPFYYLKYGPFEIGTARPETKFGDKYVVVHPDDKRYKDYAHGQKIDLEWINGPVTATVIKDESVDMGFGTGAMTITPWHDATDFDIAERHNLEKNQIIGYDGKLLSIASEFSGMDIDEARPKIVEKLRKKGLLVRIDDSYSHSVAINSRGGGVIEPQIKEQWFVNVNSKFKIENSKLKDVENGQETTLKELMKIVVENKEIEIIPKRFEKTYFHWIDNLRDWCISRQIWYGHRIPVYYCDRKIKNQELGIKHPCSEPIVNIEDVSECPHCGGPVEQDPDTLDTWFSSGLWTFSTLGWPKNTKDLETYHPTSLLETGYDILFFWVARMVLMSTYLLGEIPFEKSYLHGLVRDEKGRKMSKSIGNIIDPLDVINQYGTDAVRLSLVIGNTPGNDSRLSEEKIESFRNFTNKLWNIGRYVISNSSAVEKKSISGEKLSLSETWILEKTRLLTEEVSSDLEGYRFSQAGEKLRDFTWNEFADWYIEASKFEKTEQAAPILRMIFADLLKLWHPFMPFVTETLWQKAGNEKLLMASPWPDAGSYEKILNDSGHDRSGFDLIREIIRSIRNARLENKIASGKKIDVLIDVSGNKNNTEKSTIEFLKSQETLISRLRTGIGSMIVTDEKKEIPGAIRRSVNGINISIPLEGLIDKQKEREISKKKISALSDYVKKLDAKISNPDFSQKAPPHIIENEKKKRLKATAEINGLKELLKKIDDD